VTAKGRSAAQVGAALDASFAAIRAVEKSMSLFNPKSEISRFNASGILRKPSPLFTLVLDESFRIWRVTEGAFDPSVQPLWDVWSTGGDHKPSQALLASARARIGLENLSRRGTEVSTRRSGKQLTFNGIAQGYASDLVTTVMRRHSIESAYIDTGELGGAGDLFAQDKLVGVRNPRDAAKLVGHIPASGKFIATSGDYATAFSSDFSAHHIFDPCTGISPKDLSSVTVQAPTGAMADALATAFMVAGRDKALKLARSLDGVDALLISKTGDLSMSEGMRRIFRPA
jgi:FAD:protein FMN transferase